ncbi:uncharacterized protein N7515_004805 [Penicillium bovifimosum]|uniref:Uncharacterized protein n=1 Tax=Penicillium bovifimosum TaxID=126998 RepID=A0A9W9L492_9EURO|nr:uncharacterized protein N7515_004805 [Penicillium bovifimosum]KAJ5135527.1 hypothetical protein N7515_004805 [Penicillium bovifimosum]
MSEHERQLEPAPAQSQSVNGPSEQEDVDLMSNFDSRPSRAQIARYREKGTQLQRWIDDAMIKGCTVAKANLTMQELINNQNPDNNWEVIEDTFVSSVVHLPETGRILMRLPSSDDGAHFRHMSIKREAADETILTDMECESSQRDIYEMTIGNGFIAGHTLCRRNGPHCNEIMRAFYEQDFGLETLKYVAFTEVINAETAPLVVHAHYPRRGLRFETVAAGKKHQIWPHGTREFQEILGTEIGKTVAYLLLCCFERGTRRISQIRTWSVNSGFSLCIVFEIGKAGASDADVLR